MGKNIGIKSRSIYSRKQELRSTDPNKFDKEGSCNLSREYRDRILEKIRKFKPELVREEKVYFFAEQLASRLSDLITCSGMEMNFENSDKFIDEILSIPIDVMTFISIRDFKVREDTRILSSSRSKGIGKD